MRASWFVTAGTLSEDRASRERRDLEATLDVTLSAPGERDVVFYAILSDERHSQDFAVYRFRVER